MKQDLPESVIKTNSFGAPIGLKNARVVMKLCNALNFSRSGRVSHLRQCAFCILEYPLFSWNNSVTCVYLFCSSVCVMLLS